MLKKPFRDVKDVAELVWLAVKNYGVGEAAGRSPISSPVKGFRIL